MSTPVTTIKEQQQWRVVCACGGASLDGHGDFFQLSRCHCVDCRKAGGGTSEVVAMINRRQVPVPDPVPEGLRLLGPDEFHYQVPRYVCAKCDSYMLADVGLCPPAKGYALAMVPTRFIIPQSLVADRSAEYHIHVDEKVEDIEASDPLPQYESHPGGAHGPALSDYVSSYREDGDD
jgi:hypothetical protein